MNKINSIMFIVPILALLFTISSYLFISGKLKEKGQFRKLALTILFLGFVSNLVWEFMQIPLYKSMDSDKHHYFLCALGSLADAVMVTLLYFIISFLFKDYKWPKTVSFSKVAVVMIIGGLGAALSEKWHVNQGNWNYSEAMPLVPVLRVGLSPVAQFTLLPIVIYYFSAMMTFKNGDDSSTHNKYDRKQQ